MDTQQAINLCNTVRLNIEAHDFRNTRNIGILKAFKINYDLSKSQASLRRRHAFCEAFGHVARLCGYEDPLPMP